MVTAITMPIHSLSPPPAPPPTSSLPHNPPSAVQPSLAPWFFSTGRKNQQISLFLQLGLRSSVHLLPLKCSKAATTTYTDMGLMLLAIFQEIGIEEKGAKILLENHPGLVFMSFESLRARIQLLQSVGFNGLKLSQLVAKRPDVLTAKEIDDFLYFLGNKLVGSVDVIQLERLFRTTHPRFLLGFEGKVGLLFDHGIPRDKLAYVLNGVKINKAFCLKSLDEIERLLVFLNRFGGADLILRRPAILNYDLESQLIPRINFLFELSGGNEVDTAAVLRRLPFILAYTVEHLKGHVEFLASFAGLSDEEIFRIVLVFPSLFSSSRQRKLQPRIHFLKQCGLSPDEIFKFLIKAPLFLSLSFEENLAYKLVLLVKIGYKNRTKELALAMGAVTRTSYKNMQEVISLFLNYGLTCDDILAMAKKHPQVLQYNHGSLEEKIDYLIGDMGREIGELLAFPAFLGYQLDGRIKHRYEEKKKILGEGMSLNKLLSVSTATFSTKKEKYLVNVIDSMNLEEG